MQYAISNTGCLQPVLIRASVFYGAPCKNAQFFASSCSQNYFVVIVSLIWVRNSQYVPKGNVVFTIYKVKWPFSQKKLHLFMGSPTLKSFLELKCLPISLKF